MKEPTPDLSTDSSWSAPAAELLDSQCRQIEAYAPADDGADEAAVNRAKSSDAALTRADLPAVLQSLVERYEARHPGTRLEPLRYVSIGSSDATAKTTNDPVDGDVVSLSVTETIIDAKQIQVWSRVLLARPTDASQTQGRRG